MKFSKPQMLSHTAVPLTTIGVVVFLPWPHWIIGGIVGFMVSLLIDNLTE